MPRRYHSDEVFAYLRRFLPEMFRALEEGVREWSQASVWFVGIASAMLALLVANAEELGFLAASVTRLIVLLLGVAIVSGILHRLLLLWAAAAEMGARFALLGYVAGHEDSADIALEWQPSWSNDWIVHELKNFFDLDYSFLLDAPDATDRLRAIYDDVYKSWRKSDRPAHDAVADQLGRYFGLSPDEARSRFGARSIDKPYEHREVVHHGTLFRIAAACFWAGGAALIAATIVFCGSFVL
jgi:hypothetical protein